MPNISWILNTKYVDNIHRYQIAMFLQRNSLMWQNKQKCEVTTCLSWANIWNFLINIWNYLMNIWNYLINVWNYLINIWNYLINIRGKTSSKIPVQQTLMWPTKQECVMATFLSWANIWNYLINIWGKPHQTNQTNRGVWWHPASQGSMLRCKSLSSGQWGVSGGPTGKEGGG